MEVTLLGLLPQAHRVVSTQPTAMPSSGRETSRNEFGVSAHSSSAIAETVGKIQESKAQPQPVQQAIAPTQQPQSALEIAPTASPKPPKPVEEAPATVNSPPVTPIKSPKPPAVAAPPVTPPVESEPEKQSITRDFDIAEIWQKVVSCLQPPTTQALLKQQCHLVDFDGSSAVVGISS